MFLPEVNDEVLVAFEQGDLRRPYVLGGLWNGVDKPKLGDGLVDGSTGDVKRRGFVSKGHCLVFFDDDSDEGVAVLTGDKGLKVSLNKTKTTVHVSSSGAVKIDGAQDVRIKAGTNLAIEAGRHSSSRGPRCPSRRRARRGQGHADPAELTGQEQRRPEWERPPRSWATGSPLSARSISSRRLRVPRHRPHHCPSPPRSSRAGHQGPHRGQAGGRAGAPRASTPHPTSGSTRATCSWPPQQRGTVTIGSTTVLVEGKPAARAGSLCTVCAGLSGQLTGTAATVLIGG